MTRKHVLALLCSLFVFFCFSVGNTRAQANKSTSPEVSLSIGDYQFFLFGYTSPHSLVSLEGVGIFDQTYSNSKGYFEFRNRFSPFSTREPCLSSQDQLGRVSHTICIPPFPLNRNTDIGPVLLPPTVYLDKFQYYIGDKIVLSGQTIPNTDVNLSFFIDQNYQLISLVKPAYAISLPKLSVRSDAHGNFAISLPSSQADYFRVFVQDVYQKQDSPRSNSLAVKVLPWWMIIVQFLLFFWDVLRSRFFELIILAQIIALTIYFFKKYLRPHVIAKTRALILREKHPLLLTDHQLTLREEKN